VGPRGADPGGAEGSGHSQPRARRPAATGFAGKRLTVEHRAKISASRYGPNGANAKFLALLAADPSKLPRGQAATFPVPSSIGLDGQPLRRVLYEPKKRNPEYQAMLTDRMRYPAHLKERAKALGLSVTTYDQSLAMAIRRLDGGRESFLKFIQLAAEDGDSDALKFVTAFTELRRSERQYVSVDLICAASGVSRTNLLKTIVGIAFEHSCEVANLVAATAHPAIVEATVESAKRLDSEIGQRDRHALLTHAGFLPTPRGAVINVNANASASAQAAAAASADGSVPSFLDDINDASAARDVIEGSVSVAPMVDAET
jgi:hypothetical protein